MFHYQNNLYFGRCIDGSVRVVKFETSDGRAPHALWLHQGASNIPTDYPNTEGEFKSVRVVFDLRIPAQHWASIVASVSAGGESDGRYYAAREFHNSGAKEGDA